MANRRDVRFALVIALAFATVLGVGVPPSVVLAVESARADLVAGRACAYQNLDLDPVALHAGLRCVAEQALYTRGRVDSLCITDWRAQQLGAMYTQAECRGKSKGFQAEAIAQARAIRRLNDGGVFGESALLGITANLQWETAIPNGLPYTHTNPRPDLLLYDRKAAGSPVYLVEMKTARNGGIASAEQDMRGYRAKWLQTDSGRDVRAYSFATPFLDEFFIRHRGKPCKYDPSVYSGRKYTTHSVPGVPGVLVVDEVDVSCPKRERSAAEPESYDLELGKDENANGIEDFSEFLDHHPELWANGVRPAPIKMELMTRVKVTLHEEAIVAVTAAMLAGGADVFRQLLPKLLQARARTTALAAAGSAADAILAGVTAADWAAFEAGIARQATAGVARAVILSTGFIYIPHLFAIVAVTTALLIVVPMLMNAWGDPHLGTLDGLAYDLHSVGEFHLLQVPSEGIDIQARFTRVGDNFSQVGAVVAYVGGEVIELHPGKAPVVHGDALTAETDKYVPLDDGGAIFWDGVKTVVSFPRAAGTLTLGSGGGVGVKLAPGLGSRGLLGNNDGLPGNDLVTGYGEVVSARAAAILHGRFADSWRLKDGEGLFSYLEGESTDTFTDRAFPANIVTIDDVPAADRDIAAEVCAVAGVAAGPQFEDCVLDVFATGDQTFATQAAAVTGFLEAAGAKQLDAAGSLTESYEQALAPNLRPNSLTPIGGSLAAGPIFDGSGYGFSVPSMPRHATASAEFDLYVVGFGSGSGLTGTVAVKVDGSTALQLSFDSGAGRVVSGSGQLTALGEGLSAQGSPYRRYKVALSVNHVNEQIQVALSPTGFRGLLKTSVALDDLTIKAGLVVPDTSSATLPLNVGDGTVNDAAVAGAGRLETAASQDIYRFSVPDAGAELALTTSACPNASHLMWELRRTASGARVATGACGRKDLGRLSGGAYEVVVSPSGGHAGSYRLDLRGPESFTASLPLSVGDGRVNEHAAVGAGKLEAPASQDVYRFSVPTAGAALSLSATNCPETLRWQLHNDTTGAQDRYGTCGTENLGFLAAGAYRLVIAADEGRMGTYSIDVRAPQVFAVNLPLTVNAEGVNGLFAVEGVGHSARRCSGRGRGLLRMEVPRPFIRETSTCLTLPSRALT